MTWLLPILLVGWGITLVVYLELDKCHRSLQQDHKSLYREHTKLQKDFSELHESAQELRRAMTGFEEQTSA